MKNTPFIDIFCRVIDNYGDIGVCWRLAKDLHRILHAISSHDAMPKNLQHSQLLQHFIPEQHHSTPIRLWVDDVIAFSRLEPLLCLETLQQSSQQIVRGIEVHHWTSSLPESTIPAPIVIEGFGTALDESFMALMPNATQYWFNLEYLSAEPWVENFHACPSPQKNGVPKYFFFPGFSKKTGGLIREEEQLQALKKLSPQDKAKWLGNYLHPELAEAFTKGARFISLFCYPSAPFAAFLEALANITSKETKTTYLLLPEKVLPEAETIFSRLTPEHHLHLVRFAFCPQEQFDVLLHLCDLNIVRGEDSFVRAIWAQKPFVWHIYEQSEHTHLEKLHAWLHHHDMPDYAKALHQQWNAYATWRNDFPQTPYPYHQDFIHAWEHFLTHHEKTHFYQNYAENLANQLNLSFSLLNFQTNTPKQDKI